VEPAPAGTLEGETVIDTIGRTQQLPVVSATENATEVTVSDATVATVSDNTESDDAVAASADADPAEHSASDGVEADAGAGGVLERVADSEPPISADASGTATASVLATSSLVGTELVNGLRSAGRHLSRPSASEGHLRTELTIAARRIDALVRANDAYDDGWAIAAMALIHDAGFALEQRRISDGWQLLRAAQTEMLEGLDRRNLLVERANISGCSLADDESVDLEELRSEVWAMRQTKNRYLAELDRRLVEGGRGLLYRGLTLFGLLILGAIGVIVTSPSSNPDDALGGIGDYLTTVGLAMTGAAVSYVVFSRSSSRSASISEVVNPLQILLLRLAFGGVVGLLLVVLLQAGVQDLVNVGAQSAYLWAVLGGFSERLVDRLIDQVEGSAEEAAEAACREGV
jgi:hypothetical protein